MSKKKGLTITYTHSKMEKQELEIWTNIIKNYIDSEIIKKAVETAKQQKK